MSAQVSVIVSTFNGERYIKETISSLLAQTFTDFELIVVNDGSSDRTAEILEGFKDNRLLLVNSPNNSGIASAQNKAISMASGEFLALQDHDDVSVPDRLARQIRFLNQNSHVAMVGSACLVIDEHGNATGRYTVPCTDIELKWSILTRNPIVHTSLMMRREAFDLVGPYSGAAEFRYAEDYEFVSRFAELYSVANVNEALVKWRSHSAQTSARNNRVQEQSALNIQRRNMERLLMGRGVDLSVSRALQELLLSSPGQRITASEDEVREVENLILSLQDEFYRKYEFASGPAAKHRRKVFRLIGKHFVTLACRPAGNVRPRKTLLKTGFRFLLRASTA